MPVLHTTERASWLNPDPNATLELVIMVTATAVTVTVLQRPLPFFFFPLPCGACVQTTRTSRDGRKSECVGVWGGGRGVK